jgi:hypothetical protein
MCNGCDNWEIIVESGAIGKSQRSSRRNRCQARHTSFAFPTDLKKLSKKYAPLENIVESEEEESSEEEDEDERTEATAVPRRTNRLETNRPERNNNVNDNDKEDDNINDNEEEDEEEEAIEMNDVDNPHVRSLKKTTIVFKEPQWNGAIP